MNVLSLFDGMSCGKIALDRAGVMIDNYFASEIDKYAIKISNKNYPDIVQLGDVTRWREWDLPKINIIIGGSPCQGFSNSGLGLNFEDPRSKLFFEFVNILKFYKPDYFLLENVKMKKEWAKIISDILGVEYIEINSALVSAQSRKRFYWTNIEKINQPEDKNIALLDILENGCTDRNNSYCLDANYFKGGNLKQHFGKGRRQLVKIKGHGFVASKEKEVYKSDTLRFATPENYFIAKEVNPIQVGETETEWRKLTPLECERLQTVPDNYTEGVSNTQRYKMLGNGWTIDVIAHIFSCLPKEYKNTL